MWWHGKDMWSWIKIIYYKYKSDKWYVWSKKKLINEINKKLFNASAIWISYDICVSYILVWCGGNKSLVIDTDKWNSQKTI